MTQTIFTVFWDTVYNIWQCFSIFLLPRNPTQAWRSLTEPHALIRESSDVFKDEATGAYGLISLAGHWGQSRHEDDKADKDDQYEIWPHY